MPPARSAFLACLAGLLAACAQPWYDMLYDWVTQGNLPSAQHQEFFVGNRQVNRVTMLRPLAGEVAVARYSVAYRLMTFVLMVPVLVSNVLFPVYSRLWAPGGEALRPFFQRSLAVLEVTETGFVVVDPAQFAFSGS